MGAHGFDLSFPPETLTHLEPTLEELGFTIEKAQVLDPITYSRRTELTALKRATEVIYLAHLGEEIANIKLPADADLRTLAYLEHCLPKMGVIIIMSKGVESPSRQVERLLGKWRQHQVAVRFISWQMIDDLRSLDAEGRAPELARVLEVEMPGSLKHESPDKSSNEGIGPNDMEIIVGIMAPIARTYEGGGRAEQFFRTLIDKAELGDDREGELEIGLHDGVNPKEFAEHLIEWAKVRGRFTREGESREIAVLGAIILSLMDHCGDDQKRQLLAIAERGQLLDELKPRRQAN
jgi:hypothetical protein